MKQLQSAALFLLFVSAAFAGVPRKDILQDKNDFALRDNLKMLEPVAGGTVFREIGIIYPLKWTVRAMWPTLRDITRKELYKIGRRLKCAAETPLSWNEEKALDCQRRKSSR